MVQESSAVNKIPQLLRPCGINEYWQIAMVMPQSYRSYQQAYNIFPSHWAIDSAEEYVLQGHLTRLPEIRFPRHGRSKSPFIVLEIVDLNLNRAKAFIFGVANELQSTIKELSQLTSPIFIAGTLVRDGNDTIVKNPRLVDVSEMGRMHVDYQLKVGRKKSPEDVISQLKLHIDSSIAVAASHFREMLRPITDSGFNVRAHIGCPAGVSIDKLLYMVHHPETKEQGWAAQQIVERMVALVMAIEALDSANKWGKERIALPIAHWKERVSCIPFKLTPEQVQACEGLIEQLKSSRSTHSMLIGDVGTGKTCIFGVCSATVCDAGGRVAVMLPSQNLALQIYTEFCLYFPDLKPQLVIEGVEVKEDCSQLWVGTTALLHKNWSTPFDLVVTDEQHKYSVKQREKLCQHGAHLLESTATPVPRTAALLKHGAITLFRLTSGFVDKQLATNVVTERGKARMFSDAISTLRAGNKISIICALKEHSKYKPMEDVSNANEVFENWQTFVSKHRDHLPPDTKVVLAHGGLTSDENKAAIEAMKKGEANILITTTLVETGVTIPGLLHIIVTSPDRLGLVQHHQLRGRLARHGGYGQYDMYLDRAVGQKTVNRLQLLCQTTDGLQLAMEDMHIRGFGDLNIGGNAQVGESNRYLFGRTISVQTLDDMVSLVLS